MLIKLRELLSVYAYCKFKRAPITNATIHPAVVNKYGTNVTNI